MSTPLVRSSGVITTTGIVISTGPGVVSYASASSAAGVAVYDGTSTAGVLLGALATGARQQFNPPVQFQTGLWVVPQSTVGSSAGSLGGAMVHYS